MSWSSGFKAPEQVSFEPPASVPTCPPSPWLLPWRPQPCFPRPPVSLGTPGSPSPPRVVWPAPPCSPHPRVAADRQVSPAQTAPSEPLLPSAAGTVPLTPALAFYKPDASAPGDGAQPCGCPELCHLGGERARVREVGSRKAQRGWGVGGEDGWWGRREAFRGLRPWPLVRPECRVLCVSARATAHACC